MTQAQTVITRCTRDGRVAWQAVANMLGVSRETAMRLYGPMPSVIQLQPENIGPIDELPEPECYRSPYAKGPGRRFEILDALSKRSESVDILAAMLGATATALRKPLSELRHEGLATRDGFARPTWSITLEGRTTHAAWKAVWARQETLSEAG
jgi:hypothetical protein